MQSLFPLPRVAQLSPLPPISLSFFSREQILPPITIYPCRRTVTRRATMTSQIRSLGEADSKHYTHKDRGG